MPFHSARSLFPAVAMLILAFACVVCADTPVWRTVTPEEIAMKESTIEPNADAEGLFWEITMDDKKSSKLTYTHYVRIKILTEKGRDRFSRMDVVYTKGRKVEDIAARVIKSDGTITELKPTDIFDRQIIKAGRIKVNAKSFAVPGIEPGVIVEYQYTEAVKNDTVSGERLVFQRDIPIRRITYYIRPFRDRALTAKFYNMPPVDLVKRNDGFLVASVNNVKAFREEPYMPPSDESLQWAFVTYGSGQGSWGYLSMLWRSVIKESTKPTKAIRAKAEDLTRGSNSDEEKLRRMYEFVQRDIRNATFDRTLTEDQVEKLKIKDVDDVLRRGVGSAMQIDLLFASLANAAGFTVGAVLSSDRSEILFTPEKYPFIGALRPSAVTVTYGTTAYTFNPGTPYLPFGSLIWQEEASPSLFVLPNSFAWAVREVKPYTKTTTARSGEFTLKPDGTLEGTARIAFDGHHATIRRREQYRDSPETRENDFKDEIRESISNAEITNISIENFDDNSKPLVYTFNIKVLNYGTRIGRRMIVQPGVFTFGSRAVFTAATRNYDIYFTYPWSESDNITIDLPDGFEVDAADEPGAVRTPNSSVELRISLNVDKKAGNISYTRNFHFGADRQLRFHRSNYENLKRLFDLLHSKNTQAVSLIETSRGE